MLRSLPATRQSLTAACLMVAALLCPQQVPAETPAAGARCTDNACPQCPPPAVDQRPSWVFKPSTFSHAPETGARVAQYQRHAPVEELPDPRLVTSGYRRTRTNLRGGDGSIESHYQVQSWGNGRGGLDAEWERFHDAWRQSFLSGGFYGGAGFGGQPGYGFQPGYGYGPGPGYGYGPPMNPHAVPPRPPHPGAGGP